MYLGQRLSNNSIRAAHSDAVNVAYSGLRGGSRAAAISKIERFVIIVNG